MDKPKTNTSMVGFGDGAVKITAPATIANLVCGFDVLGMAISEPFDEIEIRLNNENSDIRIIHTDDYNLSTDPAKNVIGAALKAMQEEGGVSNGFDVTIKKHIKPGSGLGSSAASSAGAVVAANCLLNEKFSKEDLVRFAMHGEKLASGVKHADNIAPCIYGGITLIRAIHPLDIVPLSFPPLHVAVVHPQIEVKTSDARQILRKEVQLKDAIRQWGNIAGLVTGFIKHDYSLIGRSLEDVIIEPVRSILIPGFYELKQRSKDAGALGGGISGSGPSIFMLCETEKIAKDVEKEMQLVYDQVGVEYKTYVSVVNGSGVGVVNRES